MGDYVDNGRIDAGQDAARAGAGGVPGDGTAILHGPDQMPGGRPDLYDGLGSSRVNSSIGSQWREQIDALTERVSARVPAVPDDLLRFVNMNVCLLPR